MDFFPRGLLNSLVNVDRSVVCFVYVLARATDLFTGGNLLADCLKGAELSEKQKDRPSSLT